MGLSEFRLNARWFTDPAADAEVEVVITLRVMNLCHAERDDYRIRDGSSDAAPMPRWK